ncbi:MAG: O-antigen ligase family protein [Planctomycetes bacterium]|nr:O-antigen ligase family protein [Planctomycetota bacterium]
MQSWSDRDRATTTSSPALPARSAWRAAAPLAAVAVALPLLGSADPLGREVPRWLGLQAGLLLMLAAGPFALPRRHRAAAAVWLFLLAWLALFVLGVRDRASLAAGLPLLLGGALALGAASVPLHRSSIVVLGFALVTPAVALAVAGAADSATGGSGVVSLGNPNRVGEFVAAVLPVAAAFLLLPRHRGLVAVGLIAVVLLLGHAVLCKSRGGLLVGAFELVAVTACASRLARCGLAAPAPWRRLSFLTIALLLGLGGLWIAPATRGHLAHAVERVGHGLGPDYPANRVRLGLGRATFRLVLAHPLGVGHGGFEAAFVPFREPVEQRVSGWRSTVPDAHNQYLHTAAETGIAGGIVLAALLALTAILLLRRVAAPGAATPERRAVRIAAGVSLLGAAVGSLVSTPLLNPAALAVLALAGGAGAAAAAPDRPPAPARLGRALALAAVALSLLLTVPAYRSYRHRVSARDAYAARNVEAVVAAWTKAAAVTPEDAEVWQWLARAQAALARTPEAALASLDRALAIQPDLVACLLARADLLAKLRRFAEAAETAARAVELQRGNPHPHLLLGKIRDALGDPEEAALSYRETIRADRDAFRGDPARYAPSAPAAQAREALVGHLEARAERIAATEGRSRAAAVHAEILELDPRHAEANLELAAELRRQGREDEAARHRYVGELETGIRWLDEATRLGRQGDARGAASRFALAIRHLTLAMLAEPASPEPYYYLAAAHALRDAPEPHFDDRELARARLAEARARGLERLEEAPGGQALRAAVRPYWSPGAQTSGVPTR